MNFKILSHPSSVDSSAGKASHISQDIVDWKAKFNIPTELSQLYKTALENIKQQNLVHASQTVFISYAWEENQDHPHMWFIRERLAKDLTRVGFKVILDVWQNRGGRFVSTFPDKLASSKLVIIAGTLLGDFKYNRRDRPSVFKIEQAIANIKAMNPEYDGTIIPMILEGESHTVFSPTMQTLCSVDMRDPTSYFNWDSYTSTSFFYLVESMLDINSRRNQTDQDKQMRRVMRTYHRSRNQYLDAQSRVSFSDSDDSDLDTADRSSSSHSNNHTDRSRHPSSQVKPPGATSGKRPARPFAQGTFTQVYISIFVLFIAMGFGIYSTFFGDDTPA